MDEVPSDHVAYLEKLIPDQHPFSKTMWPGGVSTEPFIKKLKVTKRQRTNKQSTPLKKSLKPQLNRKKSSSKRKQTRISNYFTRSQPTSFTIEDLQEIVNGLTEKYNIIHSETLKMTSQTAILLSSANTKPNNTPPPSTTSTNTTPPNKTPPSTTLPSKTPPSATRLTTTLPTEQTQFSSQKSTCPAYIVPNILLPPIPPTAPTSSLHPTHHHP
ncbi:hypothetical protein Bca4012_037245 [Brassica carinata]